MVNEKKKKKKKEQIGKVYGLLIYIEYSMFYYKNH